jgi:hypothetical protein
MVLIALQSSMSSFAEPRRPDALQPSDPTERLAKVRPISGDITELVELSEVDLGICVSLNGKALE